MRWRLCLVCLVAVLPLASCSSTAPTEQIRVFSESFKAANDAGQPLLDDLAVAERWQGQINAARRAQGPQDVSSAPVPAEMGCPQSQVAWRVVGEGVGFIQGYCIPDAPYFAGVGDPPATRAFRDGLAIVGKYADVLVFLAEGRNLEEVHAELNSLSGSISGLISFFPGGAAAVPAIGPALSALQPLIDAAAQAQNDREVRRLVAEGAAPAKELIQALQDASPEVFATLTSRSAEAATSVAARDAPEIAKPDIERIEAYRVTVSNFVMLLEELKNALDEVVIAAQNPGGAASLKSLAEESAKLQAYADAVRKAYAALRSGG
jgi:phosphohistidine phosphatase SixA